MGKVEAFFVVGLDLWFNSSDHLPPHIHARKRGTWEIRVYFLTSRERQLEYEMKWTGTGAGPNRREREALLRGFLQHRDELLLEWETKVVPSEDL